MPLKLSPVAVSVQLDTAVPLPWAARLCAFRRTIGVAVSGIVLEGVEYRMARASLAIWATTAGYCSARLFDSPKSVDKSYNSGAVPSALISSFQLPDRRAIASLPPAPAPAGFGFEWAFPVPRFMFQNSDVVRVCDCVAEQRVAEILAVELDAGRVVDARDLRERGKQVRHPDDGIGVGAVGGDVAGPAGDQRLAETAFEHVALGAAERAGGVDVVRVDATAPLSAITKISVSSPRPCWSM